MCALFGISIPLQVSLFSCCKDDSTNIIFSGKVIIIGAGAGGLAAGYLLKQQRVDFEILEALVTRFKDPRSTIYTIWKSKNNYLHYLEILAALFTLFRNIKNTIYTI